LSDGKADWRRGLCEANQYLGGFKGGKKGRGNEKKTDGNPDFYTVGEQGFFHPAAGRTLTQEIWRKGKVEGQTKGGLG